MSTERYESFNHIFRLCSIHSNRQAPSRDIARSFAAFDRCRHILMGGSWWDPTHGRALSAGPGVRHFLERNPFFADLLGIGMKPAPVPGSFIPVPANKATKKRKATLLASLVPDLLPFEASIVNQAEHWYFAKSIITQNGDRAAPGAHIVCIFEQVCSGPPLQASEVADLIDHSCRGDTLRNCNTYSSPLTQPPDSLNRS